MKNWRNVFGATGDITKKDVNLYDLKPYKTKNKKELPNNATYVEDKFPTGGDSATVEVKTWKSQNKEYEKAKKKEDRTGKGSPVMLKDRYETLDDKLKDNNVFLDIQGGTIKHSWKEVLSDVNVTKQPDGKLVINIEENQMLPSQPQLQELPQQEPISQEEEAQPKKASKVKSWEIKKEGNLSLIGKECQTHAGIGIFNNEIEIKFYKEAKNGHGWNEIINQGKWETEFDEIVNAK
jgi:hypothetical protein